MSVIPVQPLPASRTFTATAVKQRRNIIFLPTSRLKTLFSVTDGCPDCQPAHHVGCSKEAHVADDANNG